MRYNEDVIRRKHFAAMIAGLPLAPSLLTAGLLAACPLAAAAAQPMTIGVAVEGSVPGISDAELPVYLADTMNSGADGEWHFVPVAPGGPKPRNRIEWAIRTNASAEGSVRTYGFSRATMERLIGVHQFLSIEVTLYLDGQYQTAAHSEVTASGGPQDPDLMADVVRSTKQLIAYSKMDTTAKPIPGGK